jgi:hypothetical protein
MDYSFLDGITMEQALLFLSLVVEPEQVIELITESFIEPVTEPATATEPEVIYVYLVTII